MAPRKTGPRSRTRPRSPRAGDAFAHARLLAHVGNSPLAEVEWDAEFRVVAMNPRAEALFGWRLAELAGKRIDEIPWVPAEDWPGVRELMAGMRAGILPSNVHPNRNLRKDGTVLSCEWYNSALHDRRGRLTSVLSLVLDVSERERALAALSESRAQLALFVEHAPAAIAMLDHDLRYLAASRRYVTDYRLGGADLRGRSHDEVFPETPARWKEVYRRCLAGAVERCEADPFPRADGRVDWVRWEIRPWRSGSGEIGGLLVFSEVVTELREMERRAAHAERRLAVETLIRGMSHEVNSPLACVITNVGIALEQLRAAPARVREAWCEPSTAEPRDGVEELRAALEDAAEGAARVREVVREMGGYLPRAPDGTACEVHRAVERALRLVRHELVPCAATTVEVPELPPVAMPEDDLVQVVATLLVNAGQATGTAPNRVRVSAESRGADRVGLEISDTGVGMTEDVLRRVFDPFFTTRASGRGKGLGVPRCRALVEAAGGELSYRSAPGAGTTVTLTLPVAPQGAATAG